MSSASNDNTEKSVNGTSAGTDEEAYTAYLEDRLSRTLSQIEGAGEVKVNDHAEILGGKGTG